MNRSRERFRLARLAVALGGLERAVGAISGATRVTLLVWGLSQRDYGLYVTILGFVATAQLSDFGLHFGLINAVSKAHGEDDPGRIRALVATGFAIYSTISIAAVGVAGLIVFVAPLSALLGVPPDQLATARLLALIGFAGIFVQMPLRVVAAALMGLQEQHLPAMFRTVSMLLQLASFAVVIVVWRGELIPVAIIGAVVDPLVALGFAGWARRYRPLAAIRLHSASIRHVRTLFGSGLVFFITGLANLFRRTVPVLVISNALTPEGVPPFSVPFALFAIALSVSELVAGSLWPAYGEAAARGDWPWVERAFQLGSKAALIVAMLFAALGTWAGDDVVALWASKIAHAPRGVFVWLALWLVTQAFSNAAGVLLCGLGRNRIVMLTSLGEGALTIALTVALVRSHGVQGVALAMMVSGAAGAFFLNAVGVPRATERKVRPDVGTYLRLVACGALAFAIGWPVRGAMHALPPAVRLACVAMSIITAYAACVWIVVFSSEERTRVVAWLGARVQRRAS